METDAFYIDDPTSNENANFLIYSLVGFNDSQAENENWQPLVILIRDFPPCSGIVKVRMSE